MTESSTNLADSLAVRPSYDEMREAIPSSAVREKWRAGDEAAARARTALQRIHDDETLSDEGKKQEAQRIIDRSAGEAREHYAKARETAAKDVESAYKFSVPMPDGCLATSRAKDSSEIVAVQGEAERIVQKVTGKSMQAITKEVSKNPNDKGMRQAASSRVAALKEEYERAMELGGLEGKVLAHATLRAADAVGVDYDSVVNDFRNDRQRRYVEEANQLESFSSSIPSGKNLSSNPYDTNRSGGKKRIGTYGSANKAPVTGGRPKLFEKKRRRSWK
ncbi:MAG: hypothetical protein WKF53_11970 [Rubrobacter sp.]